MMPPWFERAVKLGREAFGLQEDSHPEDIQAAEDAARGVLESALPALLNGLLRGEPTGDEQSAAMGHYGWLPKFRAVMGRRRARIEKEMVET